MSQFPPPIHPGPTGTYAPHRASMVLVLGILGLVVCFICGIIAWVMGNADLREMDAGRMDPAGRGMTQAGKICGMIGVILASVVVVLYLVFIVIAIIAGAAGAGGGGVGP